MASQVELPVYLLKPSRGIGKSFSVHLDRANTAYIDFRYRDLGAGRLHDPVTFHFLPSASMSEAVHLNTLLYKN